MSANSSPVALTGLPTLGNSGELYNWMLELYEANALPLYRGTVARSRLEKLLGIPSAALRNGPPKWEWAQKCVDEFDAFLRKNGHGTAWEEKVPAIRKHLKSLHAAKKLPINQQGKLNKTAILTPFGLPERGSPWVCEQRAPMLKELLDEYSDIVSSGDYSQYKYEYLEDDLKEVLSSEDMPLAYGRLVNIKHIAKRLGVNHAALRNTPRLNALIEEKQREVDLSLRRGKTKKQFVIGGITHINVGATPWSEKHGRAFDFTELIEPYGLEFAEKVGTVFVHIISKQSMPKTYYSRTKHFLLWLPKNDGSREIVASLSKGKLPERDSFERSVLTYRQAVLAEAQHMSGAGNQQRKTSFTVITKFCDARIFPQITLPGRGRNRRYKEKDRNPKPSLVEAVAKDSESIKKIMEQGALYREIPYDCNKDTNAFANTLAAERARRDDLPEDLGEAFAFLCEERLYELRREATKVFRQWYGRYQNRQPLINRASHNGHEIKQRLDSVHGQHRAWSMTVADLFPKNDRDLALSNLLALVDTEFHGICPPSSGTKWGQFWRTVYSKVGGSPFVQAHLLPTSDAVSAAVCLYLCESGANTSVGLELTPNPVRPSKLPKHVNVVSTKGRSKGKSIYNDLPAKTGTEEIMSAAEALEILDAATKPLRDNKLVEHDELLLFATMGSIRTLKDWQLRQGVKEIADASETLSKYTITPSMIRPTVLLHAELKHPGNLTVANMIAQHNDETTTLGYVAKLPYRMIMENRIRGFMDTLQIVIADGVNNGYRKLGIEVQDAKEMSEHAQRTGLGVFCSNPLSGAQADYPSGEKCKAVDRCIECKKSLVIAHPESIADMIIWQESLKNAQTEWLENRCQRWEEIWTPWLAFFHVVLNEKMSRGELAAIKNQAVAIVDERKRSPDFIYPEPW